MGLDESHCQISVLHPGGEGLWDMSVDQGGMSGASAPRPARLMAEVRRCLRLKHYSLRTEQAYIGWIRWFILANDKRHPRVEVQRDFLSGFVQHLAALQIPDPF